MAWRKTTQTGGTQWGLSYNYDGFGNLTDQTTIKGSPLGGGYSVAYNASTNRQTGDTADANGNIGSGYIYDIDNRLVQPGSSSTVHYGYNVGNKRVWRGDSSSGLDEIAFWAGQKVATYQISTNGGYLYFNLTSTNVYFGAKLISKGTFNSSGSGDYVTLAPVVADRLGSTKKFYPFGVERPSATSNDTEKFTGYLRDAATGLDYANARYHQPGGGRFMTPDPFSGSANSISPGSWNRYAYVGGDPVNYTDPTGRCATGQSRGSCAVQGVVGVGQIFGGLAGYAGILETGGMMLFIAGTSTSVLSDGLNNLQQAILPRSHPNPILTKITNNTDPAGLIATALTGNGAGVDRVAPTASAIVDSASAIAALLHRKPLSLINKIKILGPAALSIGAATLPTTGELTPSATSTFIPGEIFIESVPETTPAATLPFSPTTGPQPNLNTSDIQYDLSDPTQNWDNSGSNCVDDGNLSACED